jgi:hypothetical protein
LCFKVVARLQEIKFSRCCVAGGATLIGEVSGVIGLVTNLAGDTPPQAKDVATYSKFFILVLKRCEAFYQVEAQMPPAPGALFGTLQVIRGEEAVLYSYKQVERLMDSKNDEAAVPLDLALLQPFKTYNWVLSQVQKEHVRKWLGIMASRAAAMHNSSGNLALDAHASSCEAIVLAAPTTKGAKALGSELTPRPQNKAAKKTVDKKTALRSSMMNIFKGATKG